MSYDQKDLLKFALDLYQRTKETGLINHWNKDGLESILELIKNINPRELLPSTPGGEEKKNRQEPLRDNPQEDENHTFWKEEAGPPQNSAAGSGQAKAGNISPVSIYETVRDVNIQAILPGVASPDDLQLFISQEALELYGIKAAPGGASVDNFHKKIRLPATVEPAGAKATYRNGLLSLSAPKKKPDPPLQISVKFE